MGWATYEIPKLELRGKVNIKLLIAERYVKEYPQLCKLLMDYSVNDDDGPEEFWYGLKEVLIDRKILEETVDASTVKRMIETCDAQLNFAELNDLKCDFYPIDVVIDSVEIHDGDVLLEGIIDDRIENYESKYGREDYYGYALIAKHDNQALIGIQVDCDGNIAPNLVEAYGEGCGDSYIPDASDIFDSDEVPHRELIGKLDQADYMAYRYSYREPEGSEEEREYAEYRDVFGPMRLDHVKIKLSSGKIIKVDNQRWDGQQLEISLSHQDYNDNREDLTSNLDTLATKYTKYLIDADLEEWLAFLLTHHEALGLALTKDELDCLTSLAKQT